MSTIKCQIKDNKDLTKDKEKIKEQENIKRLKSKIKKK